MLIGWRTDLAVSASNVGEQDANRAHVALKAETLRASVTSTEAGFPKGDLGRRSSV
jgi:hypothetical protein